MLQQSSLELCFFTSLFESLITPADKFWSTSAWSCLGKSESRLLSLGLTRSSQVTFAPEWPTMKVSVELAMAASSSRTLNPRLSN